MAAHLLSTSLELVDDKVKMNAVAPGKPEITTGYFPPIGTGEGYTPLELILISFSACLSTTMLTILRHGMKKRVMALSAKAEGIQRDQMPMILKNMSVVIDIEADDLTDEEASIALSRAEQICPVWNMIREGTDVDVAIRVTQPAQ